MDYILFQGNRFYSYPIYDNYYASKKGKIYSKKRNKLIKLYEHKNGYLNFNVYFNSHVQNYRVHRYVF